MKRFFLTFLVFLCFIGPITVLAGCKKTDKSLSLSMFFYSSGLQDRYEEMAAVYKEETGITLDIESAVGEYRSTLMARINSGNYPDVFMSSAYSDNIGYRDYSYDLSNEGFIRNIIPTALEGLILDGQITGYPFNVQSHSYIYNKKVFRDAGITELPRTFSEFEEAARKIEAIGVQPFATGFFDFWVLPQTAWHALAPVIVQNYGGFNNFINRMDSGALKFADIPEMANVFDILDLIKKYGGPKPMESDYQNQCSLLALGEVGIIHQGIWAEGAITQVNPNAEFGFLLGPSGEDAEGAGIMYDSNQTLRVYKGSRNLKLALDWLHWMATSEYGRRWIPEQTKSISPVIGAEAPDTNLARETVAMLNDGVPAYPWFYQMFPSGSEEVFGAIFQGYCAGITNRRETIAALDDAYMRLIRAR